MPEWPVTAVQTVIFFLAVAISLAASAHVVLNKREARAAIGWIGMIWMAPFLGAILYGLLGINRIRRKARRIRAEMSRYRRPPEVPPIRPRDVSDRLCEPVDYLEDLAYFVSRMVKRPLLPGNRIEPLLNGDQAYPAMLEAIDGAQKSISLASYIFDQSPFGCKFVEALARAQQRGVEIRVLLDDVGSLYHGGIKTYRQLKRRNIPAALFMRAWPSWQIAYFNLRNHRKLMVADGKIGFTGGINIQAGHVLSENPARPRQDLHFRVQGPVTAQLQEVFAEDWEFTTGEPLNDERWFPSLESAGATVARGISEGPDADFERIRWTLMGALACARSSVRVVTPYFLPDLPLITALGVTSLRGVKVDILLPQKSDNPIIHWAMFGQIWQALDAGCRVWLSRPPFDHTKLMIVDGNWTLLGSPNWDSRSLRLNFEFAVECYDAALAQSLSRVVDEKIASAKALTRTDLDARSFPIRLRDGSARLLMPYL